MDIQPIRPRVLAAPPEPTYATEPGPKDGWPARLRWVARTADPKAQAMLIRLARAYEGADLAALNTSGFNPLQEAR